MVERLPSLHAIKVFETAARHRNFTEAADELCLTQGSVSRQIKLLEEELNDVLFERVGHRMVLTESGRRFGVDVREAFELLRRGTETIRKNVAEDHITLRIPPIFFTKILAKRLKDFQKSCPNVELRLANVTWDDTHIESQSNDLFVGVGRGEWPFSHVEQLSNDDVRLYASPSLRGVRKNVMTASEIAALPLLFRESYYNEWPRWFDHNKLILSNEKSGKIYSDELILIQAAVEGEGVILMREALVADEIKEGQLVSLSSQGMTSEIQFHLVATQRQVLHPSFEFVRVWLKQLFYQNKMYHVLDA